MDAKIAYVSKETWDDPSKRGQYADILGVRAKKLKAEMRKGCKTKECRMAGEHYHVSG